MVFAVELICCCGNFSSLPVPCTAQTAMGVILLSGVIIMYCVCIDNTRLMVVSCGGDWLVLYCVEWMVLFELLLSM